MCVGGARLFSALSAVHGANVNLAMLGSVTVIQGATPQPGDLLQV